MGLPSVAPGKSPGCAEIPLIQSSTSLVIHAAAPSDSTIRKKEYKKLQKYQGLGKEHQQMWRVKAKVIGTVGSLTPKLSEWLQLLWISGTTPRISVWLEKIQLALAFYIFSDGAEAAEKLQMSLSSDSTIMGCNWKI